MTTAPLSTKPRLITEVRREEYAMHFVLRVRRAWNAMKPDDRAAALRDGAEALEAYARQMRTEAEEITA